VDVDKPLGLQLAQGKNGLKVKSASGNAAKAGIQAGDTGMCRNLEEYMYELVLIYVNDIIVSAMREFTVIYSSSFFGDELWPADKLVC
jgi:hypothetical protein